MLLGREVLFPAPESLNSVLIQEGLPQSERLIRLNSIAIHQMQVLDSVSSRKLLK